MSKIDYEKRCEELEGVLHRMYWFCKITLDDKDVQNLTETICKWARSHEAGNGDWTDEEVEEGMSKAYSKMINFKSHKIS